MSVISRPKPFKYRHYQAEIILICLRWYLRYSLSYRDLEEMIAERGPSVDHTTIYRWVQRYGPILEKRCRAKLKPTNDSWRVDETYIKVKGEWMFLYRAVDSNGATVEFMLGLARDAVSAGHPPGCFLQESTTRQTHSPSTSDQRRPQPCLSQSCSQTEEERHSAAQV